MSPPKKNLPNEKNITSPLAPGYSRYKCVAGSGRMRLMRDSSIAAMRRMRGCQGGVKIRSCDSDEEEKVVGKGSLGGKGSGSGTAVVSGLPSTEKVVAQGKGKTTEAPQVDTDEEIQFVDPESPSPTVVIELESKEDAPGSQKSPIHVDAAGGSKEAAGTHSKRKHVRSGPPGGDPDDDDDHEYYMWFY